MIEPEVTLYEYRAVVVSVYDGDTLRADIDCGFGIWKRSEPLRLYGINAPELHGDDAEAGRRAGNALRGRVLGRTVFVRTIKPSVVSVPAIDKREKYGRFLAVIWSEGNVNDWLVSEGLAVPYMRTD